MIDWVKCASSIFRFDREKQASGESRLTLVLGLAQEPTLWQALKSFRILRP